MRLPSLVSYTVLFAALPFLLGHVQVMAQGPDQNVLQGKIEHSDTLSPMSQDDRPVRFQQQPVHDYSKDPLPNGASPGPTFNTQDQVRYKERVGALALAASKMQPQSGRQARIAIPEWLAGQWQRSESNELSRVSLPSGEQQKAHGKQKASVIDIFGSFRDKAKKVWMIVPLAATGMVDRGDYVDYHKVKKYELVPTGALSALVKVQASHWVMDKRTGKLAAAYQDEELNQYRRIKDGLVETKSSVKVFDAQGQPRLLTRAVSQEKRIKRVP